MWLLCFFLGHLQFPRRVLQLVTLLEFRTYLAQVSWPTPAVDVYCWVGGVLVHHLVFYLVPAQLPLPLLTLSGFCTLSGSSLLVYSCGGALLLGWRCLDVSLGFLPCAVLFLRGLPLAQLTLQQVPLGIFRSPSVCTFCFPGDVDWASALPFFSVLLLLRLARRGSLGSAPCVRVLQLGWCLLSGRQCRHPASFPLP